MSNAIDNELQRLAEALEPALPGRVYSYPLTPNGGAAIWIGIPSMDGAQGSSSIAADFPVTVSYDGADRAQVAGVNDLVARCWDACERLARCTPLRSRPIEPSAGEIVRRRTVVITVRIHIATRTLCPPPVSTASPIPPEPIPV